MKLADYLSDNNLSQTDFAKKIKTSPTTVSRYVAGLRLPRKDHLIKIREATGWLVTADDFFEDRVAE